MNHLNGVDVLRPATELYELTMAVPRGELDVGAIATMLEGVFGGVRVVDGARPVASLAALEVAGPPSPTRR